MIGVNSIQNLTPSLFCDNLVDTASATYLAYCPHDNDYENITGYLIRSLVHTYCISSHRASFQLASE